MKVQYYNINDYMSDIADLSAPRKTDQRINCFLDTSIILTIPFGTQISHESVPRMLRREFFELNGEGEYEYEKMKKQIIENYKVLDMIMEENAISIGKTVKEEIIKNNSLLKNITSNNSLLTNQSNTYVDNILLFRKRYSKNIISKYDTDTQKIISLINNNSSEYSIIEEIVSKAYESAKERNKKNRKNSGLDHKILSEAILYSAIIGIPVNLISADYDFLYMTEDMDKYKYELLRRLKKKVTVTTHLMSRSTNNRIQPTIVTSKTFNNF
ncbi:MAG: hypothetical protein ACP5NV_06515 [Candidatus Woesearchaeota archaeon]